MKRKCVFVIAMIFTLSTQKCFSQSSKYSFIPSAHLTVTYNKTTNLIFPFTVQSIDRGSKDILVQQPKGTENIVQVKADKPDFRQTNLSIITSDGQLYSFTVDYANQPNELNIVVAKENSNFNAPVALSIGYNEALIKSVCERISEINPKLIETSRDYQMKLQLNGIYINGAIIYFRLRLQNNSNVGYDADNISFIIKDRQNSKRTATQEMSLTPVWFYHAFTSIEADSAATCIIAVPKFTLPDSKYLLIQVPEKKGERNLSLYIKNKHIIKATAMSN